ncbi:MAG: 4'-phosphopantetheinyl transferase superfamily protein [Cryomorphaceae bacterium]|jgi:phosphopantetheinyl transferase|nr:4'-phosphopantetheinyl transferase superfamily protein [Cryomorphaceae bacterium]
MTFKLENIHKGTTLIYLLHYSEFDPMEFTDRLTPVEIERLIGFSHLSRKREFVATRILRNELFGAEHIHYDQNGAPYIEREGFISISHSATTAALAFNPSFSIGLDLEEIGTKARRVYTKFLSEEEIEHFDTMSDVQMTQCWSAKECLYKLAGHKEIDFKRHLKLERMDEQRYIGTILSAKKRRSAEIHTFVHGNLIVSINGSALTEN